MTAQEPKRETRKDAGLRYVEEGTAFIKLAAQRETSNSKGQAREQPTLPSPSRISDLAFAFHRTAALRAAVELDVFTAIGEAHDTASKLGRRCAAAERGLRILCDMLAALGLLERTNDRYSVAPDAATYLDRRSPAFIGDALAFVASETALTAALNDPAAVVRNGGTTLGETEHFAAPNQPDWTTYARAVAPVMARSAGLLADLIASRGGPVQRILDIAAGPGQNGIALARRVPDARVTAVDWPDVLEIARQNARASNVGERWQAVAGSALEADFVGLYDVALVARFLHLVGRRERESLLSRVYAALAPGGRIAVLQLMLNDDHVSPPFAAIMNFNVLTTTPVGEIPTAFELETLLHGAGFRRLEWHELPDSDERIVIGLK